MAGKSDHLTTSMVPIPDPTKLTTDAVDKAKSEIKELFGVELRSLRELTQEKFAGVAAALEAMRDMARQQNDSNTTAISKSESSTSKQLDSLNDKIEDLKKTVGTLTERNWAGGWAAVGGYIVGAIGVVSLVATLLVVLVK